MTSGGETQNTKRHSGFGIVSIGQVISFIGSGMSSFAWGLDLPEDRFRHTVRTHVAVHRTPKGGVGPAGRRGRGPVGPPASDDPQRRRQRTSILAIGLLSLAGRLEIGISTWPCLQAGSLTPCAGRP